MGVEYEDKMKKMTDFRSLMLTSIVSAFALVVALFWNDAIKSAIEEIVPKGEGLFYKFLVAIIVTIIVVIFIYIIMRSHQIAEKIKTGQKIKREWKKWERKQ